MNNRNYMKMQKTVIFEKNMKIKKLKIRNVIKLGTIVIIQVNIKVHHIVYVVLNTVYLNKLP